jgi:hypothetical protein
LHRKNFCLLKPCCAFFIFLPAGKEVHGGNNEKQVSARSDVVGRHRPRLECASPSRIGFRPSRDVVKDPDLTTEEKRAILSSWASDACSVESQPGMRLPPRAKHPIGFDEIVDALRSLDSGPRPKWKRVLRGARSGTNENPDGGLPRA